MKRKSIHFIAVFVLAALAIIGFVCLTRGNLTAVDMRVRKQEGTVNLYNEKGVARTLTDDLRLTSGCSLETKDESLVAVSLDDIKLITMGEDSNATIKKNGKKLEYILNDGELFFNVTEKLSDDEVFDIRTSNMIVGIRGTSGYVCKNGNDEPFLMLTDGKAEVTATDPDSGAEQKLEIMPGEMVTLSESDGGLQLIKEYFVLSNLPRFVLDLIREDQELSDRIEAATGYAMDAILYSNDEPAIVSEACTGKLRKETLTTLYNDSPTHTESDEHFYDESGNKIKTIHSEEGIPLFCIMFTNDEQGRTILEEHSFIEENFGSADINFEKFKTYLEYSIESEYDSEGKLVHRKKNVTQGYLNVQTEYEEFYTYDSNGKLIEVNLPEYAGNTRVGKPGKYIYTYSDSNTVICKFYYANGEEGEEEYTRKYDDAGQLTFYEEWNPIAGYTNESRKNIEYDDKGNITAYTELTGGSEWGDSVSYKLEYEYNPEGNIIKCTKHAGQGLVYVYDYEYY